jgi:hypothetical protein
MSEFLTRFSSISDLRKGDPFNSLSAPFQLSKIRRCMQCDGHGTIESELGQFETQTSRWA